MPKLVPHIDKLVIAKWSLDMPPPAIAERSGLNLLTIRSILEDEEIRDFVESLKEARMEGFRAGEMQVCMEYTHRLCLGTERHDAAKRTKSPPPQSPQPPPAVPDELKGTGWQSKEEVSSSVRKALEERVNNEKEDDDESTKFV